MVQTFVQLTLFSVMFALGLGLRGDAPAQIARRPFLFVRVLLGTCLLVPLLALVLLHLPLSQQMSPPARLAIALMAACPSAPLTLRKAGATGGDRELAALLQVTAAVAAIVSIPLLADLFTSSFGLAGWDIGPGEVARQVGVAQVLPLGLGLGLRRLRPALAQRLLGPLDRLANVLLVVLLVLVLLITLPRLLPFFAANLLALGFMAALVLAALAIGYGLAGPAPRERITVALVTSMRNPGLALLFAGTYAPGEPGVKLAILTYLLLTVILSVPFLRWQNRQAATASIGDAG